MGLTESEKHVLDMLWHAMPQPVSRGHIHQALYAAGPVTRDSILAAAANVGIDRAGAQAALTDKRYDAEIEKNLRLAQALGATGTPTFIVGDQLLSGAVGYEALRKAIEAARAKK